MKEKLVFWPMGLAMMFLSIVYLIKRRSVAGKGHSWLRLLMCERAIKTIKLESSYAYCLLALVGGSRNELADFVG